MRTACSLCVFQAEDGIRDAQESRGLGDVYKRQGANSSAGRPLSAGANAKDDDEMEKLPVTPAGLTALSLIHI